MNVLLSILLLISIGSIQGGEDNGSCKELGGQCVPSISNCHQIIRKAKCSSSRKCCATKVKVGRMGEKKLRGEKTQKKIKTSKKLKGRKNERESKKVDNGRGKKLGREKTQNKIKTQKRSKGRQNGKKSKKIKTAKGKKLGSEKTQKKNKTPKRSKERKNGKKSKKIKTTKGKNHGSEKTQKKIKTPKELKRRQNGKKSKKIKTTKVRKMKKSKNKKKGSQKRKCKKTPKKCKKKGGVCTNYKDECLELISEDLCKGFSCNCCKEGIFDCDQPKKKCIKKGGTCKNFCEADEDEISRGCKGKGCKCCVPFECKIKPSCSNKGGKCVFDPEGCDGDLFIKGCKGNGCLCCVPVKTTTTTKKPTTTTKKPTTTTKKPTTTTKKPTITTKKPSAPTEKTTQPPPTTTKNTPTTTPTPIITTAATLPPTTPKEPETTTKDAATTTIKATTDAATISEPPIFTSPPTTIKETATTTKDSVTTPKPTTVKETVTTKDTASTPKPTDAPTTTKEAITTSGPSVKSIQCGIETTDTSRIVGGVDVTPIRKYSWQVGLAFGTDYYYDCGGSIITDKHILTAAHCFYETPKDKPCFKLVPSDLNVGIGDHNQLLETDNLSDFIQPVLTSQVFTHENYSCLTKANDVAIIELSKSLDLLKNADVLHPICLPKDDSQSYEGVTATVSGWGDRIEYLFSTPGPQNRTIILKEVQLLVTTTSDCETLAGADISQQICAAVAEGGKDTCQGDSGGPLTVKENGQYAQIGVVSYGAGCASKGNPGVYARVGYFLDWIKGKVGSEATYSLP